MKTLVLCLLISSVALGQDAPDRPLISKIDGQYYFLEPRCVSPKMDEQLNACRQDVVRAIEEKEKPRMEQIVISAVAGGLLGILIGLIIAK